MISIDLIKINTSWEMNCDIVLLLDPCRFLVLATKFNLESETKYQN